MSAWCVTILFLVLLLLTATGAGIFPWTLVAVAIVLTGVCVTYSKKSMRFSLSPAKYRSPYLFLLLYIIIMLIPLPNVLHKASPIRSQANEIAAQHVENLHTIEVFKAETGKEFSLSRNRSGTMRLLLLCIAGFSGWFIIRTAPNRLRERWLYAIVCMSTIVAIAGVLGKWVFPQGDTLFWYIPVPHGRPGPMGGFMNRNHFAGYLAILVPIAFALARLACKQKKTLLASISLGAMVVLASSIVLSLSRGAMLALLVGTGTSVVCYSRHQNAKRKCAIVVISIALLATVAGTFWSIPALRSRFLTWTHPATYASAQERFEAWSDSMAIFRAYPILGAGPNAFRTVYPQHRLTTDRAARDFAENEYVQWGAETGVVGILIALGFVYIILRQTYIQNKTKEHADPELAYAAMAALAAAATHALVDFPLRLPLYAITLSSVAALLWTPSDDHPQQTAPPAHALSHGIGLLLACLLIPANLRLDGPGFIASAPPQKALSALRAAPTYPIAWRRLSAILWKHGTTDSRKQAEAFLTQAAAYDPNNYVLWRALGDRRKAMGDYAGANHAYRRVNALRDWINIPYLPEDQ